MHVDLSKIIKILDC